MQHLCNVRPPHHSLWLVKNQNKKGFLVKSLHIHGLFKIKSPDGIKSKNSISQQAEREALLSEHSRVYVKRLGTLTTKPPKIIGTKNTQVALQVFTARSLSPTLSTRSVARDTSRLFNISTPQQLCVCYAEKQQDVHFPKLNS